MHRFARVGVVVVGCASSNAPPAASTNDSGATSMDSTTDVSPASDSTPADTAVRSASDTLQLHFTADGCIPTVFAPDPTTNTVRGMLLELITAPGLGGKRCEDVGAAYCTPGSKPCRIEGGDLPPVAIEDAGYRFRDVAPDGTLIVVAGTIENGSSFVTLRTGMFMICETVQLAGGRVPQSEADACRHDASYTPSLGGGWCDSNDPAIVGAKCEAAGTPETLRMFGLPQMANALWFAPPKA